MLNASAVDPPVALAIDLTNDYAWTSSPVGAITSFFATPATSSAPATVYLNNSSGVFTNFATGSLIYLVGLTKGTYLTGTLEAFTVQPGSSGFRIIATNPFYTATSAAGSSGNPIPDSGTIYLMNTRGCVLSTIEGHPDSCGTTKMAEHAMAAAGISLVALQAKGAKRVREAGNRAAPAAPAASIAVPKDVGTRTRPLRTNTLLEGSVVTFLAGVTGGAAHTAPSGNVVFSIDGGDCCAEWFRGCGFYDDGSGGGKSHGRGALRRECDIFRERRSVDGGCVDNPGVAAVSGARSGY